MSDLKIEPSRSSRQIKALSGLIPVPLSPADAAWEADLLLLLSNLEASRSQLSDHCHADHAGPSLETMIALVEQVVSFAAVRLDVGPELVALRARADAFYASARPLLGRLQRSAWQRFVRLFWKRPSGGDARALFLQSSSFMVDVLTGYFDCFRACFQSVAGARAWHEAGGVFLSDLRGLVAQLQA